MEFGKMVLSTAGRWWKVMEGFVAATEAMYGAVEPVSKGASLMMMVTENEGW